MIAALLNVLLAAAAPPAGPMPVTVRDVNERYRELDHRIVEVRGWLGRCHSLSCPLFQDRPSLISRSPRPNWLSIDFEPAFDAAARQLEGSEILLRGRVNAECLSGDQICTDRAPDIEPVRIVRVFRHVSPDHSE